MALPERISGIQENTRAKPDWLDEDIGLQFFIWVHPVDSDGEHLPIRGAQEPQVSRPLCARHPVKSELQVYRI